ncbi:GlsB/YeaQ/YmgE family stress response membrane protein [Leptonema illini]
MDFFTIFGKVIKNTEDTMGFFAWIIMGLLAGIVAKLLMPGKDPGGWIITILLGIAGAFVGGYIGSLLGFGGLTGFSLKSFLLAVGGAVILLFAYRLIKK